MQLSSCNCIVVELTFIDYISFLLRYHQNESLSLPMRLDCGDVSLLAIIILSTSTTESCTHEYFLFRSLLSEANIRDDLVSSRSEIFRKCRTCSTICNIAKRRHFIATARNLFRETAKCFAKVAPEIFLAQYFIKNCLV